MKNNKLSILIAAGLIIMAGAARIINHEMHLYNFAPVCALGLFSGAVIKDKKIAFLLPILAQLMGDIYISLFTQWPGFYGIEQACVYTALLLVTVMGTVMNQPKALKVLGYTLAGAVVFFLVSNFGVFLAMSFGKTDLYHYGTGFTGLVNTYVAAIPFFKHTLIGEFSGSILLFGAYYLLQQAMESKVQKAGA
ncbi:MAG: hypothetical protein K0Q79_1403 [Flavipsychrobacter sp.]|jgi:hypothetical protein|nr:hypothetical protein [Flavipsychrobacter sp.]